jgi:hypothetical protein
MTNYKATPRKPSSLEELSSGRFVFRIVYRDAGSDEGLTIHVFGPANTQNEEVLRFDCFRSQPHYHLAWSYRDEPLIPIKESDSFGWTLEQLAENTQQLLARAGAEKMTPEELEQLPGILETLRARGEALVTAAS